MNVTLPIYVLFLHFLADFVFQSDAMAKNKARYWSWLILHIGAYAIVLALGLILALDLGFRINEGGIARFVWLNAAVHFVVDAITSRINSYLYREGRIHDFFVGVGADQFIHAATLLLTLRLLVIA